MNELKIKTKNISINKKIVPLINEINSWFNEKSPWSFKAKELIKQTDEVFKPYLDELKIKKDELNSELKKFRAKEKELINAKALIKKEIDNFRFQLQDDYKEKVIEGATHKVIYDDENGQEQSYQTLDSEKLEREFKWMNKDFKQKRLLKKDIEIKLGNLFFSKLNNLMIEQKNSFPNFISIDLNENYVKEQLIDASEKELPKKIKDYEEWGIFIEISK